MTSEVQYCFDDEDVQDVCGKMADQQVRRLPVVNRVKRLVGILSLGDLAKGDGADHAGQALGGISQPAALTLKPQRKRTPDSASPPQAKEPATVMGGVSSSVHRPDPMGRIAAYAMRVSDCQPPTGREAAPALSVSALGLGIVTNTPRYEGSPSSVTLSAFQK